jgi:hypothetical protein
MRTSAATNLYREPATELCTVLERSGSSVRVRGAHGERRAEIAAACLLSPAPGDRVLVVYDDDEAYVLSVLRQSQPDASLTFPGDVSLTLPAGRLRLLAQHGVELISPRSVRLQAGSIHTRAKEIEVGFSLLDLVGTSVLGKAKSVKIVAEAFDTIAGRLYQRAVHFLRRTDELDRVEAKNIDRRAEQLYHVHAENTVATAEQLVKVDGSQVHVG